MIIKDHDSFIEITFQEALPTHVPGGDLSFTIMANCDSFVGSDNSIWIERSKFNQFLEDFKTLVSCKEGSAELKSISPYKFQLRIHAKTHDDIRAQGELCKKISKGETDLSSSRIVFEIQIDPKKLPDIFNDFSCLIPTHLA